MSRDGMKQVIVLCNLIVTSIWLTLKLQTSAAVEQPIQLSIVALVLCALAFYAIGKPSSAIRTKDVPLDQEEDGGMELELDIRTTNETSAQTGPGFPRRWYIRNKAAPAVLGMFIVLRVFLTRSVVKNIQCSWNRVDALLPLFLYAHEYFANVITSRTHAESVSKLSRVFELRYIFFVAVWTVSGISSISLTLRQSTYICPLADRLSFKILILQLIGIVLDAGIFVSLSKICRKDEDDPARPWRALSLLFGICAGSLSLITFFVFWLKPELTDLSQYLDRDLATSVFFVALLFSGLLVSIVYLIRELRPSAIILTVSAICFFTHTFSIAPYKIGDLLGSSRLALTTASFLTFISLVGILYTERQLSISRAPFHLEPKSLRLLTTCLLGTAILISTQTITDLTTSKLWANHPIDILISRAKSIKTAELPEASSSMSLAEAEYMALEGAVNIYKWKYGIHPPPNFDKWHKYAISRNSAIIDDFDQIHTDLLPFWGIQPSELREMTGHMLERPWVEVAGVRISSGVATISPHMPPTHRWMIDGVVEMINKFVEFLPDMDLAFNINDENRVAVPWAEMRELKARAEVVRIGVNETEARVRTKFVPGTIGAWQGNYMEDEAPYGFEVESVFFEAASFVSSFDRFGAIGCPPESPARKQRWWNKKSFCRDCIAPHSLGEFVQDWTLSGSVCHQPDIANLHGLHLSPAAFKTTKTLFPIFSQSKIPTYNDILYPSPWNYVEKVIHDDSKEMLFSQKDDTVFWRGATSEGFSTQGSWQGMQRQRFVHLLNTTPNTTFIPLFLPTRNHFQQTYIPVSSIRSSTSISVSFVDAPSRCSAADCQAQTQEFIFRDPVDFQSHWSYKYLFDLDGAGFSGRFLPFLQSRSLVFRAAAFRQWFDDRLVPWRHFVPVDGRLGDVWGLLAYFGGIGDGGHEREAERIAEEGRRWAERVLRREDMEVYMFRLLLEWGRVVDDRRAELGFVMPPAEFGM